MSAFLLNSVVIVPAKSLSLFKDFAISCNVSKAAGAAPIISCIFFVTSFLLNVSVLVYTLFNAVLLSGLQIDQVRNHSKTSHYAPRGRDAMVNDGDSDLRFTNNFDHAVYIQCYRSGSSVNATIYGSSQDKVGVSIQVDNFTYNGLPAAKTYRTITKNGKSKKSYIYTSVYKE